MASKHTFPSADIIRVYTLVTAFPLCPLIARLNFFPIKTHPKISRIHPPPHATRRNWGARHEFKKHTHTGMEHCANDRVKPLRVNKNKNVRETQHLISLCADYVKIARSEEDTFENGKRITEITEEVLCTVSGIKSDEMHSQMVTACTDVLPLTGCMWPVLRGSCCLVDKALIRMIKQCVNGRDLTDAKADLAKKWAHFLRKCYNLTVQIMQGHILPRMYRRSDRLCKIFEDVAIHGVDSWNGVVEDDLLLNWLGSRAHDAMLGDMTQTLQKKSIMLLRMNKVSKRCIWRCFGRNWTYASVSLWILNVCKCDEECFVLVAIGRMQVFLQLKCLFAW